ncbi:hypothetical protein [Bartonella australis]|uniref:hypothetical protein n=1 Tax=Bartonella australis TaxID=388640 RepID=UPI0005A18281|nr:hypothetical protein [Bartonella australis]
MFPTKTTHIPVTPVVKLLDFSKKNFRPCAKKPVLAGAVIINEFSVGSSTTSSLKKPQKTSLRTQFVIIADSIKEEAARRLFDIFQATQ